ncbi:MAG: LLM class F420-dependent oxidoreductase [Alphaproteobacteria bacterium]|nr:LLM class F420-dependent oxidoreductase [Alphaproteobacteria bacterium]
MLIGTDIPTRGPFATPDIMARIAREAEALGFGYLTLSDHVLIPRKIAAPYPYTETGAFPLLDTNDLQEQLTAVAWLAGQTTRIRFHTSVMVVPHRPAVLTAKILSTIDVLSKGRLSVGCGAGWMREEFEALGTDPFDDRGTVTDEYLQAFRALWTQDNPRFAGKYVNFADVDFSPKPVQKPHPPLWIGGESPPALRRAAKYGDGWYPIPANPKFRLDTFGRYKSALGRLRQLAAEAGRDPQTVKLAYRVQRHGMIEDARADDGERKILAGDNAQIVDDIQQLESLGVSQIDVRLGAASVDQAVANMRKFRDDVMAKL